MAALADGDGYILQGRATTREHTMWLGDAHGEQVTCPSAGVLELVGVAAHALGNAAIKELSILRSVELAHLRLASASGVGIGGERER